MKPLDRSEKQAIEHEQQQILQQLEDWLKLPMLVWNQLNWLDPSFIWMLSAAGSGELLFTPQIATLYGYALLWALLAAVILKWFINREVGRFTVGTGATGATILEGFEQLPGPKNWAVWLILLPQFVVTISTVAGMAGVAAKRLLLVTSGTVKLWTVIIILVTAAIVFLGQYNVVEKVSFYVGIACTLAVGTAAIFVFPSITNLASGLVPQVPQDVQYQDAIVFITFCSTTLSVQDGFGRMFADGTQILLQGFSVCGRWINEQCLRKFYLVTLLATLPVAVYLLFGEPVSLLQTAGGIEAADILVVTGLTLYLNHRILPETLHPSKFIFAGTVIAGLFFAGFAGIYSLQLIGIIGGTNGA